MKRCPNVQLPFLSNLPDCHTFLFELAKAEKRAIPCEELAAFAKPILSKFKRTHKSKHKNKNSSLVKVHVGHRRHVPFTRCSTQGGQLQLGGLVRIVPPLRVSAACFAQGAVGRDMNCHASPAPSTTPYHQRSGPEITSAQRRRDRRDEPQV